MKIKKIIKLKLDTINYKIGTFGLFCKKKSRRIAINKMSDFQSLIAHCRNNKNKYVNLNDFSKEDAIILHNTEKYKKNFDIFEFPTSFIVEYCYRDFKRNSEENNIKFLKLSIEKIKNNEKKFIKLIILFKSLFIEKKIIEQPFIKIDIEHVIPSYYVIEVFFELFELLTFFMNKNGGGSKHLKKEFLNVYSHCITHIEDLKNRYDPVTIESNNFLSEKNIEILENSYENINYTFEKVMGDNKNICHTGEEIEYINNAFYNKSFSKNIYSKMDYYHIKTRYVFLSNKIKENRYNDSFDEVYNRNIINIEHMSNILKKIKMPNKSVKVLKKYLFKANYNYCIGRDKISSFFIMMFFYGVGKHLSVDKKYKNCIKDSIKFISSNFNKNKDSVIVEKILYSFLTKEEFSFDLRSCIVHPISIEPQITHMFGLYFFSLLNNNFKNYRRDSNLVKSNINNYKDIDFKNNKRKITKKSEDVFSLFVFNILELEEHLFLRSNNKYLINEESINNKKIYNVHNVLFQGLKDSYFNNKDNDLKEEEEIKEVCDMLILKDFEKMSKKEKEERNKRKNDRYKNKDYKDTTLRNIIFHKTDLELDFFILKKMDDFNKKMISSRFSKNKPNKILLII